MKRQREKERERQLLENHVRALVEDNPQITVKTWINEDVRAREP